MQLVNKHIPVREPVLQDVHLKPGLGYFSKISHYEVDFHNVYIELHWISMKIQATLKQEIIKLVRLSTAESVRDVGFSSS